MKKSKEYALYKGDIFLAMGTIPQIAKRMSVKKATIAYYKTPTYRNRLKRRNAENGNVRILIPIDDDEVMEI